MSHVVCDPQHDDAAPADLWEYRAAAALDAHPKVKFFVKNDHLGFSIPYRYRVGDTTYVPDFLAVVECDDGQDTKLILEVKGWLHDHVLAKNLAARKWVDAVHAEGAWGRWAFRIVYDPEHVAPVLNELSRNPSVVAAPTKGLLVT